MRLRLRLDLGKRQGDRVFAVAMITPGAILLLALSVYPFLTAVWSGFFRIDTMTRQETWIGMDNYGRILRDPLFWSSLWRSLVWTISGVTVQLVLGIGISLLLHAELPGRLVTRGIVLFPYLVPSVVAAIVWRFMLNPLTGVINYILLDKMNVISQPLAWLSDARWALAALTVVGIWKFVPFMVILFLARLQTTPLEIYDAAKIDGASGWQEFRYITIPWLMPTIIVAVLLRTIWMFNHFDTVYLMAFGGPMYATTTLPVLIRTTAFGTNDMGRAAAISMCMVVVLFANAVFQFRQYARAEEQLRY